MKLLLNIAIALLCIAGCKKEAQIVKLSDKISISYTPTILSIYNGNATTVEGYVYMSNEISKRTYMSLQLNSIDSFSALHVPLALFTLNPNVYSDSLTICYEITAPEKASKCNK